VRGPTRNFCLLPALVIGNHMPDFPQSTRFFKGTAPLLRGTGMTVRYKSALSLRNMQYTDRLDAPARYSYIPPSGQIGCLEALALLLWTGVDPKIPVKPLEVCCRVVASSITRTSGTTKALGRQHFLQPRSHGLSPFKSWMRGARYSLKMQSSANDAQ